jgi:hypothetical protein
MDNTSPTPEQVTATPAPAPAPPPPPAASGPLPGMPSGSLLPSSGPFSTPGSGGGRSSISFALIGILGLAAVVFAILAVISYNKASVATKTLNTQKAAAVAKAKAEQKQTDEHIATEANESPFRAYTAPVDFGSFEIKFPKNWSSYVDQEAHGTQISLAINPDFIRRTNNADELMATRVQLIERSKDGYLQAYTSYIKRGTIKQADITVSGQHAYDLTGQFTDKKTSRQVIVPVRDKVLVFINENSKYASEFNQILAQAKIIP